MARFTRREGDDGGLFRTAERLGITRGLFGGSKGWFYVGTGLWTLRTIRRMAERKSEVLVSEVLEPGQRLVIANGRPKLDVAGQVAAQVAGSRRRRRR
ncbi:MAG TPA: hypothetical protein VHK88_11535 [Aquihabitans sp.]|jgi:hypothetical protein|nr:hypothetical protein [Aquihabitans sp.]